MKSVFKEFLFIFQKSFMKVKSITYGRQFYLNYLSNLDKDNYFYNFRKRYIAIA